GATNSYGHPNPQVLERIDSAEAEVYRTDRDGEVVFHVNKEGLQVTRKLRE
ncbi:MAG: hypothetical protein K0Q81_1269, partial [Paenibacillus sp.]|nr:hypothetical protein [Paenibacillus sp.]